ncbi:hypothetical protein SDC9_161060 [bioreactor metagenome]|uniref:Uncharacterized protein n=1 Tax=bioreactor metagenome TaxID=1076179 RepID=A0A645FJB1_9ZZZZ
MYQYFHAMATFITEQVGAMWFDRAKGSQHLCHGRIHPSTHIHRLGREPDFINADHVASALSNSAKADISDTCHFKPISAFE